MRLLALCRASADPPYAGRRAGVNVGQRFLRAAGREQAASHTGASICLGYVRYGTRTTVRKTLRSARRLFGHPLPRAYAVHAVRADLHKRAETVTQISCGAFHNAVICFSGSVCDAAEVAANGGAIPLRPGNG